MHELEDDETVRGARFRVMDFLLFTESIQTSFSPDKPRPSLGESDLNFLINAPQDYCPAADGSLVTLYFDNADCSRMLPENTYQVRCTQLLDTPEFIRWAEQGISMMRDCLMHRGMVCIDVMDLIMFLQSCSSKKLILEIIPYESPEDVPWEKLQPFRFKNIFGALFAGNDMSLQMWADLGNALEEISPNLNRCTFGANFHTSAQVVAMLLGELETQVEG